MRLSACRRLQIRPLTGTWYRAIGQEHWKTRLTARHSTMATGRFSAGSPENPAYQILYLAQTINLRCSRSAPSWEHPSFPSPILE